MSFAALVEQVDRVTLKHFGEPVVYTSGEGEAVTVKGIFDRNYVAVLEGVESVGPAVFLRLADLPADPEDDDPRLEIGGMAGSTSPVGSLYEPWRRIRDGLGGMRLLLHKVSA